MRGATALQTLGDIRTIISTHARSTPRQKATTYLDILSLGMEKQRLETEMAWTTRRRGRIERRLCEIREALGGLARTVQEESKGPWPERPGSQAKAGPSATGSRPRGWREMPLEY